jgi:hypothetical protein
MDRRSFLRGVIAVPLARAVMAVPFVGAAIVEYVAPVTFAELVNKTLRDHRAQVMANIAENNAFLTAIKRKREEA